MTVITVLAISLLSAVAAAPQAGAATRTHVIANVTYYQIKNHDGKCLDVVGGSTANGAAAQQWTCNGNRQQYWAIISLASEYVLLKNLNSGKCLSILNNDINGGGAVIQWSCNNSGSDQFEDWDAYYVRTIPYFIYYNTGTCAWPTNPNYCGMHPSGNGTANGLKIYNNIVAPNGQTANSAYFWTTGSAY